MTRITQLLNRAGQGDPGAAAVLIATVYEELRQLARVKMGRESPGHTLESQNLERGAS